MVDPRFDSARSLILETAVVSRKTARDGKLEITSDTARRLGGKSQTVSIVMGDAESEASVVSMPCGCKGATNHVVHLFLESEAFRQLAPESSVRLELDGSLTRRVVRLTLV